MSATNIDKDTSCLFVFGIPNTGETVRIIETYDAGCEKIQSPELSFMNEPALLFPTSEDSIRDTPWEANRYPHGVPAQSRHRLGWSITTMTNHEGKPCFFLRDKYGVVEEVVYAHSHHAIYFECWEQYNKKKEETNHMAEIWNGYFHSLPQQILKQYPSERVNEENTPIQHPFVCRAQELLTKWHQDFWVWYKIPMKCRLLWVKNRLEEMQNDFRKLDGEICRKTVKTKGIHLRF